MTDYNHLNKIERDSIQYILEKGFSFSKIGEAIKKDRTTISKEIERNRYIKSNFYNAFDNKGIQNAVNKCDKLSNPPYVCNTCATKPS